MALPLEGIRVLDLSMYLPGPLCSQFLADFGAEVIKVEPPGGEPGRWVQPIVGGESARFYTVNRNKKSISINLKTEEGKNIFRQLVAKADVVLEQFRPGVMENLGLGYNELKKINEGLIHCAITGYGFTGPWKYVAGHDLNYLSIAGVTGLTGTYKGMPAMSGVQIADIGGGAELAISAILLALISREKTGKGQFCDVAMLDGAISMLSYTLGEWFGWGRLPERGNEVLTGGYACYNIYETSDHKFVSLGAIEDKFWAEFCNKIGKPEYIEIQWDKEKQADCIAGIRSIMAQKTQQEWVEFFADSDICFTPILTLEEMSEHPQVKDRNMILKLKNFKDLGKDLVLTGVPVKLSETPGVAKPVFPAVGEHNEEILKEINYTEKEIEELKNKGII